MKIRSRSGKGEKIETQMAPMIDVVFQLLIFFMLTLKIIEPEGDFDINMPLGKPDTSSSSEADLPPLTVKMEADPETGQMTQLYYNKIPLGAGPGAFILLNREIFKSVRALEAAGPGNIDKQEVELQPDFNLDYGNIISAISACSGRMENGRRIKYFSRIKFAPIQEEP